MLGEGNQVESEQDLTDLKLQPSEVPVSQVEDVDACKEFARDTAAQSDVHSERSSL